MRWKIMFLRRHAIRALWSNVLPRQKGISAGRYSRATDDNCGHNTNYGRIALIAYNVFNCYWICMAARTRTDGGCGGTGLQRRNTSGANVGNANTAEGVGRRGGHDRFGGGRERVVVSFRGRRSAADLQRRSFDRRMFAGARQVLRQRRRQSNGN